MTLKWTPIGDYSQRCAPWTVCAISNGNCGFYFELWHDKQPMRVGGPFNSAADAKAEAEAIEMAGQA